jgi:membrane protein implicated in regulation of membrane protease activity
MSMQNGNRSKSDVLEGVGAFGANLTNLAHLQMRLAATDLQEGSAKALPWAVLGLVCACATTASLVIVIGGGALWLSNLLQWPLTTTLIAVGASVLVSATILLVLAVKHVGSSYQTFKRSGEELERNLAWIRSILAHSGR